MRFIHRNRFVLLFLVLLIFSSVMVVREYVADDEAHIKRREDFILLTAQGQAALSQRLYQVLVQDLPRLSDRTLGDDLQRTAMLVDPKKEEPESLVWKYYKSVGNELRHRASRRIEPLVRDNPAP